MCVCCSQGVTQHFEDHLEVDPSPSSLLSLLLELISSLAVGGMYLWLPFSMVVLYRDLLTAWQLASWGRAEERGVKWKPQLLLWPSLTITLPLSCSILVVTQISMIWCVWGATRVRVQEACLVASHFRSCPLHLIVAFNMKEKGHCAVYVRPERPGFPPGSTGPFLSISMCSGLRLWAIRAAHHAHGWVSVCLVPGCLQTPTPQTTW